MDSNFRTSNLFEHESEQNILLLFVHACECVRRSRNLRSISCKIIVQKLIDGKIEGGSSERQRLGCVGWQRRERRILCEKKRQFLYPKQISEQSDVTFLETFSHTSYSLRLSPLSFAIPWNFSSSNFQMDLYRNGVDHLYLICFPFIMFTLHILRAKIKVDEFSAYLYVL